MARSPVREPRSIALQVAVIHPSEEKDERYDACPENIFYHRAVEHLVAEDLEV